VEPKTSENREPYQVEELPWRESVGRRVFGRWNWSAPSWVTPRIRAALRVVFMVVSGLLVGFAGGLLWLTWGASPQ
jgi:hypothetical protein